MKNRLCPACDNTKCATCVDYDDNCTKPCNGDCKTCDTTAFCTSCVAGKYLSALKTCLACDNTECATCNTDSVSCILKCKDEC